MKTKRGLGRVFQLRYRDKKTREWKTAAIWWAEIHVRGRRHRVNSHSARRADAVALLDKLKGEASNGRVVTPMMDRTTFEELASMLLDDYRVNGHKSLARDGGGLRQGAPVVLRA